jgi:hypothetical protein
MLSQPVSPYATELQHARRAVLNYTFGKQLHPFHLQISVCVIQTQALQHRPYNRPSDCEAAQSGSLASSHTRGMLSSSS